MSGTQSDEGSDRFQIVPSDESDIHDEPHIRNSRVTVRHIHERVEEQGLSPETVAERLNLDIAAVYEALAYYHRNLGEMAEVEQRRERLVEEAAERTTLTPPEK